MTKPIIHKLEESLSCGKSKSAGDKDSQDTVTRLARIYELARNAMEYRADHLVRRAAIERILKRQLIFNNDALKLTADLLQEMRWAGYINELTIGNLDQENFTKILGNYLEIWNETKINKDWLVGLISAHLEDLLSQNIDYAQFTSFAFNIFRNNIDELILYVAIDRVYSQSDEAGIAYHLYKLNPNHNIEETYNAYTLAFNDKTLNIASAWVRKQMGPLVLLRDIYFNNPENFSNILNDKELFSQEAEKVLADQLRLTRQRMNTATFRSLLYVFLTKMILGILIEMPLEVLFRGQVNYISLSINLIVPVAIMWIIVANIHLPKKRDQEKLLARTLEIVFLPEVSTSNLTLTAKHKFGLFYLFYGLLFVAVFYFIYWLLSLIGFSFISVLVFLFFLSVVTFFAYRIRQISSVYTYDPRGETSSVGWDVLTLPMVAVGDLVSRGVSQLNFLAFVFDFILEAPFKLILGFMDSWGRFLSSKRDEIVG
ncbi:MAG: hypothetical protein Q8L51_00120 [Candidatus Amesbacteria bacterium]|nr:hypothetical protein [Candidatus Amesbacteria bacterium]